MSLFSVIQAVPALLYAVGCLGIFWGIPARKRGVQALGRLLTLAGFALHGFILLAVLLLYGGEELGGGFFLSLLAWSILLVYFVAWRRLKNSFPALAATPLAFLLLLLALRLGLTAPAAPVAPVTQATQAGFGRLPESVMEVLFTLHILPMFISLGLLALAFGAGVLYLRLDRKIKQKTRLSEFDRELPALDSFDRVNARVAVAGFPLYTLAIATGFIAMDGLGSGAEQLMATSSGWDPKEIVSLFVWFCYALFFYLRLIKGWRGRKTAKLAIFIFALSAFSLLGVNFFLPTHHSFGGAF